MGRVHREQIELAYICNALFCIFTIADRLYINKLYIVNQTGKHCLKIIASSKNKTC